MDLVYQISAMRAQFSPTEHRIADACLQDPAFAAAATIDQLAMRAEVSRSALSRFAKAVGCLDIRDLRMQLAQAHAVGQRFSGTATYLPANVAARAGHPNRALCEAIANDITATIAQQLHRFDPATLDAAVALLDDARSVYVYGMGGTSTALADECQYRLVRLGKPVSAYHDPVLMRMTSAVCDASHLVVALSLSGLTPELLDVLAIARGYGAKILAITAPDTPLAQLADVILPLSIEETDFIYKPTAARYGMLFVIDVLVTQYALAQAPANQERLRRVKLALDAYRHGGERLPLGD